MIEILLDRDGNVSYDVSLEYITNRKSNNFAVPVPAGKIVTYSGKASIENNTFLTFTPKDLNFNDKDESVFCYGKEKEYFGAPYPIHYKPIELGKLKEKFEEGKQNHNFILYTIEDGLAETINFNERRGSIGISMPVEGPYQYFGSSYKEFMNYGAELNEKNNKNVYALVEIPLEKMIDARKLLIQFLEDVGPTFAKHFSNYYYNSDPDFKIKAKLIDSFRQEIEPKYTPFLKKFNEILGI